MTIWLVALVGGVLLALLSYRWRGASAGKILLVAILRALAFTLLIALLLDAVAGRPRPVAPIVALDVSQSWLRGGDSTAWRDARGQARAAARDSLFLVGDSIRVGTLPDRLADDAVSDMQAPRAVIGNDTAEFRIAVSAGRAGAGAGSIALVVGDQRVASIPVDALTALGE